MSGETRLNPAVQNIRSGGETVINPALGIAAELPAGTLLPGGGILHLFFDAHVFLRQNGAVCADHREKIANRFGIL